MVSGPFLVELQGHRPQRDSKVSWRQLSALFLVIVTIIVFSNSKTHLFSPKLKQFCYRMDGKKKRFFYKQMVVKTPSDRGLMF